ncbi:MAG: lysyl oxidase family protein [Solirubrobacteraceae bacterium]
MPGAQACTPTTCKSYTLRLKLPGGIWTRPGGMLVSVKWPDQQLDMGYDLDLYVYGPDGRLVGRSNMVIYSTAEGVWVPNPRNGIYRVVIVPRTEIGTSNYKMFVNFARGWTVHEQTSSQVADPTGEGLLPFTPSLTFIGARPARHKGLLPDLVPETPNNFHIETTAAASFYIGVNRGLGHPPSCYPQETTGADADTPGSQKNIPLRCLRWDQGLMNLGQGPLEIRVYPNNGNGTEAYQVIYKSNGTYAERKAGKAEFHVAHGHIHYHGGLDDTGLYKINRDGTPGKEVAKQGDKGRCEVDTENVLFGRPGDGPPHYYVPSTCDSNDNSDPNDPVHPGAEYFRSGISPGWDDTYPWFIPDQYIDITHVPDGRYLMIDKINVRRLVRESSYQNDVSEACVDIHGTTATRCPRVRGQ